MIAYVVESAALRDNVRQLRSMLAPSTVLWAVVKGNGYGLGVRRLTELLLEEEITHFAVTSLTEAETVRSLSQTAQILMLHPTCDPTELERLLDADVICTVASVENVAVLSAVAQARGTDARVHCKVDTGMGRYGFRTEELPLLRRVFETPGLAVEGVYTHFHSAFCDEKATRAQYAAFTQVLAQLRSAGLEPGMCHCCNSSAALRFPEMHMDAVRIGSALLGRVNESTQLKRVGWCEASVDTLHQLKKGETTGYGAGWRAKADTTLAILPVGYFHGFSVERGNDLFRFRDCIRRAISQLLAALRSKTLTVTIRGKRYPVRGHVGMLHIAVDVTGSDVRQGDVAIVDVNPLLQKGMPIEFR